MPFEDTPSVDGCCIAQKSFGIKNELSGTTCVAALRESQNFGMEVVIPLETSMRFILSIPLLAVVILAYVLLAQSGSMLQPDSTFYDTVLPSGAEIFFLVGDVFVMAGLVALFIEILKAARYAGNTILDHMLSTAAFIGALIAFLLVPSCGTVTFFLLMVMTLIDVVAGFSVSIVAARRDFTVSQGNGTLA
jgi:hypothetical protein